ncbi:apses transcription factor [Aspergillus japonicus CBS 114.51]|uniref:Cell pattern formation-associated protein stuA n=2 Tax=Aspergillus TaxID=5052 RepID=A0A2V5HEJ6_ASPV1|nr:apses transcription factor [Aspergillus japonicus CBS 114.51]PYI14380.1 apses transcription factor [Aspergillus violaceofuscus CBS 115571]RAH86501.1 apses transcription factor [Aspergillus japonicus CBS 114.51]
MVRTLPRKNNPLILSDEAPAYEELLARRRLGKTNLAVKPTQIGTSNATKPENLGPFEYAHLRAPLPSDLKGSEIFPSHAPQQHPETYFLMRRSRDGYVSATGMFKIAFPWAKLDEERSEREYLKARSETSEDEIAGNVWISPVLALELAKEYQMYDWVRALLDPTEIIQSPSSAKKQITPPPRFDLPPIEAPTLLTSTTRLRRGRSASPSKRPSSPRKPRQTRAMKEANAAATSAANATLQSSLDLTASTVESESVIRAIQPSVEVDSDQKPAPTPRKLKTPKPSKIARRIIPEGDFEEEQKEEQKEERKEEEKEQKVKVDVETTANTVDDVKTTQTTVSVELPVTLPEAPSAADTEQMIAKAKEMVEEAVKLQAETAEPSSAKAAVKRKTDALSEDEDEEEEEARTLRTKRAKVLEEKLKQERVRNRALVGVTAAFALAASIPYFFI